MLYKKRPKQLACSEPLNDRLVLVFGCPRKVDDRYNDPNARGLSGRYDLHRGLQDAERPPQELGGRGAPKLQIRLPACALVAHAAPPPVKVGEPFRASEIEPVGQARLQAGFAEIEFRRDLEG